MGKEASVLFAMSVAAVVLLAYAILYNVCGIIEYLIVSSLALQGIKGIMDYFLDLPMRVGLGRANSTPEDQLGRVLLLLMAISFLILAISWFISYC